MTSYPFNNMRAYLPSRSPFALPNTTHNLHGFHTQEVYIFFAHISHGSPNASRHTLPNTSRHKRVQKKKESNKFRWHHCRFRRRTKGLRGCLERLESSHYRCLYPRPCTNSRSLHLMHSTGNRLTFLACSIVSCKSQGSSTTLQST
jgi:hypothetical protein